MGESSLEPAVGGVRVEWLHTSPLARASVPFRPHRHRRNAICLGRQRHRVRCRERP